MKPRPQLQMRLYDRFRKAAKHINQQNFLASGLHSCSFDNPEAIQIFGHMQERFDKHGNSFYQLTVENKKNQFLRFHYSDPSHKNHSSTVYSFAKSNNFTQQQLSEMLVLFAQTASYISADPAFTFERVMELLEGHHLNEQEQKATAHDRADLLIQRLDELDGDIEQCTISIP